MKPPFSYFGGKQGMATTIVDLLPDHDVYVEPFFGSGAVFFAKEPSKYEVINDLDGSLVAFFRVLRDRPDDLVRACRLTPYSREEYELCRRDDPTVDDLERARRFWVRVTQSFARNTSGSSGWSLSVGQNVSRATTAQRAIGRFEDVAARLSTVNIECCDGVDLIDRLATKPRTVFYVDPPYLGSSRTGGDGYAFEMRADADHVRLLEAINRVEGHVVLSGYDSELYREYLDGWYRVERGVTTYSSRATGDNTRAARTEVLWLNYDPEPQEDEPEPKAADQTTLFG